MRLSLHIISESIPRRKWTTTKILAIRKLQKHEEEESPRAPTLFTPNEDPNTGNYAGGGSGRGFSVTLMSPHANTGEETPEMTIRTGGGSPLDDEDWKLSKKEFFRKYTKVGIKNTLRNFMLHYQLDFQIGMKVDPMRTQIWNMIDEYQQNVRDEVEATSQGESSSEPLASTPISFQGPYPIEFNGRILEIPRVKGNLLSATGCKHHEQ